MHVYPHNPENGFTIVELVTTLVILGILSAVALPRFFDTQAFSERGYADELASSIRYAQKIAVASGCQVSVAITASAYDARQRSNLANCNNAVAALSTQVRRADGSPLAGAAPTDVSATPAATIIFDGNGRVSNGTPPALNIGVFTLTIDPVSGLVTVQP